MSGLAKLSNDYKKYILDLISNSDVSPSEVSYDLESSVQRIQNWYRTGFNQNSSYREGNVTQTPMVSYWYALSEQVASMMYRRFPDYKVGNDDRGIEVFLDSHKEFMDSIFYDAVKQYSLYGSCLIMFVEGTIRVLKEDEYYYDPKNPTYFWVKGDIEDDGTQYELKLQGYTGSFKGVSIYYINGNKYIKDGEDVYKAGGTINNASVCLFTDGVNGYPMVTKVYHELRTMEDLYIKHLETTKALKTQALGYKTNKREIEESFGSDFKVIMLDAQANYNNANINQLFTWMDNTPVTNTLTQQEQELVKLESKIYKKLNLTEVMQGGTDNPNETRVAASDRVRKASVVWEKRQNAFNNYVEGVVKHFVMVYMGIDSSTLDLELNSTNIITEELEEAKSKEFNAELLTLLDRVNQYAVNGDAESILLIQSMVNSQLQLPMNMIEQFNRVADFKVSGIMEMRATPPQPPQPTPEQITMQIQNEYTKAQTMQLNIQNQKMNHDMQIEGMEADIKFRESELDRVSQELENISKQLENQGRLLDNQSKELNVDKSASESVNADLEAENSLVENEQSSKTGFLKRLRG